MSDAEHQLTANYQGKVLTLRQFYEGNRLRFDSDGHLIGAERLGPWTLDGQLEITGVSLHDQQLTLRGKRLSLVFDPKSNQLGDATRIAPGDPLAGRFHEFGKKAWPEFVKSADIEIELELPTLPKGETDVLPVMNAVFLSPSDDVADFVPEIWQGFVLRSEGKGQRHFTTPIPLKVDGKDVSAPHAVYAPDPKYSEVAQRLGYQATSVLWVVVSQEGTVRELKIARPAGLGLDEKAVQAVEQWRFRPALKDGIPVAVQVNVEVNFRLY